jgi:hypothetical protein
MKHQFQRCFFRIAGELLLIVTGVLIAMFVNEWNERRKQAEAFEETLTWVYTDVKKERFQMERDFQETRLQAELVRRMLEESDSIPDDVLPYALFYLDLPGADYVLSPAAAALREQVDLLMLNASTPRQLQVVKDLMDYTAWTWARQDQRGVWTGAGLGPAPLKPFLLESGLRDPALAWYYSATKDFENARTLGAFAFTPEEKTRARMLLDDPRLIARLQTRLANLQSRYWSDTVVRSVGALSRKIREAYPGLQLLFRDLSVVGSALSRGTTKEIWNRSARMQRVAGPGSRWTLDLSLDAGVIKFRTGDAGDENWGGRSFPQGQLLWYGDNIAVPAAGRYRITVDLEAEDYSFVRLGDSSGGS